MKPTRWQVWGQGPDGPKFRVNSPYVEFDDAEAEAYRRDVQSRLDFRYWVERAK